MAAINYCHQCRQNRNPTVLCKAMRKRKPCPLGYCRNCLRNRYTETVENMEDWSCPRCRGTCDCSTCMRKRGEKPKGRKLPNQENVAAVTSSKGESSVSPRKIGDDSVEINDTVGVAEEPGLGGDTRNPKKIKLDGSNEQQNTDSLEDMTSLPVGNEFTDVAGIDFSSEDVGNAFQLLEFCNAFRKVLHIEKGQAEHVLKDIFQGQGHAGELSTTIQFHIHLLALLKNEKGDKYDTRSWFNILKECLSGSQSVLRAHGLDYLDNVDDYETLDAAHKLSLLNILCDEVLATEKLKTWIDDEDKKHSESCKEMKDNLADCRKEEKILKKKIKDDIAAAKIAKNASALSDAEYVAIVSHSKSEIEKAHAKVVELQGIFEQNKQKPDVKRIKPILMSGGHSYWKLNLSDGTNVLCQNIGKRDNTLRLNEKWTILDEEGKNTIEKHVGSFRSLLIQPDPKLCLYAFYISDSI